FPKSLEPGVSLALGFVRIQPELGESLVAACERSGRGKHGVGGLNPDFREVEGVVDWHVALLAGIVAQGEQTLTLSTGQPVAPVVISARSRSPRWPLSRAQLAQQ